MNLSFRALPLALPFLPLLLAAAPAPVPVWTVDQARSQVGFSASMNATAFSGKFRRWQARIAFDPARLDASSVVAEIDTASVVTGDATRDQALPTPDWLNTAAFPRARFVSRNFRKLPDGRYVALGKLTIRGVTRDVALPFRLTITGATAQMQGGLTLDRSLFGVGQGQFAGAEPVAKGVSVSIRIAAKRAS